MTAVNILRWNKVDGIDVVLITSEILIPIRQAYDLQTFN